MIEGYATLGLEKRIFKHNDASDLRRLLVKRRQTANSSLASLYSMDGDQAPLQTLLLWRGSTARCFIWMRSTPWALWRGGGGRCRCSGRRAG